MTCTVGVIVCVHQLSRLRLLTGAVASLRAQTTAPEQMVIVVDGDHDVVTAVDKALPDVQVEWTGGRRGLSVARNIGASLTSTDLVAFLDDDAVAEPDWLERLISAMDCPDVMGASGRSLPRWESSAPGWMPPELLWTVGCSYRGMPERRSVVRNFFGGCGLVRREVFLEVRGFDPAFGKTSRGAAGGEEADFCYRALTAHPDGLFVYEPGAVIHHYVPDDRADVRYVLHRCWADGRVKAQLLAGSGLSALGPERRFVRQAAAALTDLRRSDGGAGRRAQVLVLAAGVFTAGLGCLVSLPQVLVCGPREEERGL